MPCREPLLPASCPLIPGITTSVRADGLRHRFLAEALCVFRGKRYDHLVPRSERTIWASSRTAGCLRQKQEWFRGPYASWMRGISGAGETWTASLTRGRLYLKVVAFSQLAIPQM